MIKEEIKRLKARRTEMCVIVRSQESVSGKPIFLSAEPFVSDN